MEYQIKNSIGTEYYECIRYENIHFETHIHRHPELVYVDEGEIILGFGGHTERIGEGKFALVLPNIRHSYKTPAFSVTHVCIFSLDQIPVFARDVKDKTAGKACFAVQDEIGKIARERLLTTDPLPTVYTRSGLLYLLLENYLKSVELSEGAGKPTEIVDKILAYVPLHYTEEMTLQTVARALGYERHYLSKVFHNSVKMNFTDYVNWYRVDMAKGMLMQSTFPISYIALQCGFQTIRSFNRSFLKLAGRTPRDYRKS